MWFQPMNGNAWLGPAVVVYQRGQRVYLHTHGDLKKIAECRVKPFQLVDCAGMEDSAPSKEVMLKEVLEDVENLLAKIKDNAVGVNYLRMANSVSFSDFCTYRVEHQNIGD